MVFNIKYPLKYIVWLLWLLSFPVLELVGQSSTCCQSQVDFNKRVEESFTIDLSLCDTLFVTPISLSECDYVTWRWGNGAFSGIYKGNRTRGHIYQEPGTYTVCMQVEEQDDNGNDCWAREACRTVIIEDCAAVNMTCCQSFDDFSNRVDLGFTINQSICDTIAVSSIGLDDCDVVSWKWGNGAMTGISFGNSSSGHLYQEAGTYRVCMEVEERADDGRNCWTKEICETVTIEDCAVVNMTCCQNFDDFSNRVDLGFAINQSICDTIAVSSIGLDDCDVVSWKWGNGAMTGISFGNSSSGHLYQEAGTYRVCMEVEERADDGRNCWTKEVCETVTIEDCAVVNMTCCQNFDDFSNRVDQGFSITTTLCDTAIVTPVGLDSCDFAFLNWGDGTTSTIFNGNSSLDHVYTSEGTYTICMQVEERDINGDACWTKQVCDSIKIEDCDIVFMDCCQDFDDFSNRVDQGFSITTTLCDTAIVTPVGLDSCDFAFLNWGDGTTSTIFNGNSSLDHVYTSEGTYTICMQVEERDINGDACWTKQVCDSIKIENCLSISIEKCDSISTNYTEINTTNDFCCFNLAINNKIPNCFTSIKLTPLGNFNFANYQINNPNDWAFSTANAQQLELVAINGNLTSNGLDYFIPYGNFSPVQFCLRDLTNSSQQVLVEWMDSDNIVCSDTLTFNCPRCIAIQNDTLLCKNGKIEYSFDFQNVSDQAIHQLAIQYLQPAGISVVPDTLVLNTPIAPGQIISNQQFSFTNVGNADSLKLVIQAFEEDCCWCLSDTLCLPLPPPCEPVEKCDSITTNYSTINTTNDFCCFNLEINNKIPDCFRSIRLTPIGNFDFADYQINNPNDWAFRTANTQQLEIIPLSGIITPNGLDYYISGGLSSPVQFCLRNITNAPQEVLVEWIAQDGTICSDTLIFNCPRCIAVQNDTIVCNNGSFEFNFDFQNVSDQAIHKLAIQYLQPAGIIASPDTLVLNTQVSPGQISDAHQFSFTNVGVSNSIKIVIQAFEDDCCWCLSDTLCLPLPQPCVGCCESFDGFCDRVNQAFSIDTILCDTAIVRPIGLDSCDYITWDWGDGTTSGPLTGNIPTNHIYPTAGTYLICMQVEEHNNNGDTCWTKQVCDSIKIEDCVSIPVEKCDSIVTDYSAINTTNDYCCFSLEIDNKIPDCFSSIRLTTLGNFDFADYQINNPNDWAFSSANAQQLEIIPLSGTITPNGLDYYIPGGMSSPVQFCLRNISNSPQEVLVEWMAQDGTTCSDTLVFNCPRCIAVQNDTIVCNNGNFEFNFDFQNVSDQAIHKLAIHYLQPSGIIAAPDTIILNTPVSPGQISGTHQFSFTNVGVSDSIKIVIQAFEDDCCWCLSDTLCLPLPQPCVGCCQSFDDFCDRVDQGFTITSNNCDSVLVVPNGLDSCDHVFWDFGDGSIASPMNTNTPVTHIYPNAGTYLICMEVEEQKNNGDTCWTKQICDSIIIKDCLPSTFEKCDSISTNYSAVSTTNDFCCFALEINNKITGCFSSIRLTPLGNFDFENYQINNSSDWAFHTANQRELEIIPLTGMLALNGLDYFIPNGNYSPLQFCLRNITNAPQQVLVEWIAQDSTICRDTLTFNCPRCIAVQNDTIICNNRNYEFSFDFQNVSDQAIHKLAINYLEPNGIIANPDTLLLNGLVQPGQTSGTHQFSFGNVPNVDSIKIVIQAFEEDCCWCLSDTLCLPLPDEDCEEIPVFTCEPPCIADLDWEELRQSLLILDMVYYEGQIILGLKIDPGFGYVVSWDGNQLMPFGDGLNEAVHTLEVHEGVLYAGGRFTANLSESKTINGMARYNTLTQEWEEVGGGIHKTTGFPGDKLIMDFHSSDKGLIIGGLFDKVGADGFSIDANNIVIWQAGIGDWLPLIVDNQNGTDGIVTGVGMYKNEVVFTGRFKLPYLSLGLWKTDSFRTLGSGIIGFIPDESGGSSAIMEMNEALYIGGNFSAARDSVENAVPGTQHLAKWNNTLKNWESVGGGITSTSSYVNDFLNNCGHLMVAGLFSEVGGAAINSIAQFDGSNWYDQGIWTDLPVHSLKYLPDTQGECAIYAGGVLPFLKGIPLEFSTGTSIIESPTVKVFPNPTTGMIYLDFIEANSSEFIDIQVFDLNGRCLLEDSGRVGERFKTLDIHAFSAGIYFVQIKRRGMVWMEKVVKH